MSGPEDGAGLHPVAAVAQHLTFAPVAFAVMEGPDHRVRYANAAFRGLESAGEIAIGQVQSRINPDTIDLSPWLDRAFRGGNTIRDELLSLPGRQTRSWFCTIWPIPAAVPNPETLVVELRDASFIDGALTRQRGIAERLLLAALREQDVALDAAEESRRSAFLASASRDLSMSLDQDATREIVKHRSLPRDGTWCIVDVIESTGAIHRLTVVHPDPSKQVLARTLAGVWFPEPGDPIGAPSVTLSDGDKPKVITHDSGAALEAAAHGPENLATLRELGFGALLVVPLIVRGAAIGAITFVTPEGDASLSAEEITLASDLADRCAMALDNARLYHEADALRAAADEANRAKSDFLGNMSHELRTPLNAIGGYAELIDMGLRGPVTPEQRTDLTRIRQNQQHLLKLISEILNFVRSESGRMEYRFAEVPVAAVLDDVAEMLDAAIAARQLGLDRPPGDPHAKVWADPDRVRQILLNLLINAVKYTPADGAITLSFTMTRHDVLIQVADRGPGIPPEMLETIFEPFVQLESEFTNRKGGVGLGLAISRDIARAMNGDLTVDSTVGVGSRFTLALPRAPQDSRRA